MLSYIIMSDFDFKRLLKKVLDHTSYDPSLFSKNELSVMVGFYKDDEDDINEN